MVETLRFDVIEDVSFGDVGPRPASGSYNARTGVEPSFGGLPDLSGCGQGNNLAERRVDPSNRFHPEFPDSLAAALIAAELNQHATELSRCSP